MNAQMDTEQLGHFLRGLDELVNIMKEAWVGRRVRLTRDIRVGTKIILRPGATGQVIDFQLNADAPLVIQFDNFDAQVCPLLDKLEICP